MSRFIIHCDLDAFFASVEVRDDPEYKGKPVIIGADPKGGKGRGVASTCSYEARKFGIHSGMPISQAFKRCPQGIYLKPSFTKYQEASKEVMEILESHSSVFQKVGADEAYLDLSNVCSDLSEVSEIAKEIQTEIMKKVGITISIGCAPTKSLAKIASDYKKPNGITIFRPDNFKAILKDMDITRIPGIGKKSKVYYYKKGIKTIGDIIKTPLYRMIELFGKHGKYIWDVVNGLDKSEVKEFHGKRKSISKERTFYEDTDDFNDVIRRIEDLNEKIHKSLDKNNIYYRTITLKIRFEGFITYTRSKSIPYFEQNRKMALNTLLELYKEFLNMNKKVRLIGVKFSNLKKDYFKQISLLNYL